MFALVKRRAASASDAGRERARKIDELKALLEEIRRPMEIDLGRGGPRRFRPNPQARLWSVARLRYRRKARVKPDPEGSVR